MGVERLAFWCVLAWLALPGHLARGSDDVDGSLRLNQMQVIGSHNSYKRGVEPALLDHLGGLTREWQGIDYGHPSLRDQLALGLRNLELDVYNDPEGGTYADPLGLRLLRAHGQQPLAWDEHGEMARPGFKLIHDADFDFRTWHLLLDGALTEMARWSKGHPRHLPIVVTMNLKQSKGSWPGAVTPVPWDRGAIVLLEETIVRLIGRERLLTPDDVRGSHETLEGAVLSGGWPSVEHVRGRFLFVLDEGGHTRRMLIDARPGLRGAVFFPTSPPGEPEAGFLVINDPVRDEDRIRALVGRGYMVRTRADAGTVEARNNDRSRFEAAKRSGAHVITTDYAIADRKINEWYRVRFDDGEFVRLNPVTGERSDSP